ncbi:MAG: citryl-CoA lyase [Pseudomonadota bacterium]
MNGPQFLKQYVGQLKTRMGACFPGQRAVFRGHDLHTDLRHMDWIELYVYGITGRHFSPEQLRLLHGMWVYTSYPDARIWNNRVAALAGSVRSTPALGLSAALAVSEAVIYGGQSYVRAIDFLIQARRRIQHGAKVLDIIKNEIKDRRIYGFGRPLNSQDERNPWLMSLAKELNLDGGPHVRLAGEVEVILLSKNKKLRMNYAGLMAAFAADIGFSAREFQTFVFPAFLAGMPPCFIEAAERAEGALFPLTCADVLYEGRAKRDWITSP